MQKYLILSLIIVVLALGGAIALLSPNTQATNVLGTISAFSHLSSGQFNQALNSGEYTLIDVRTIEEFNAGHLKNAKQSDYYQTQAFSEYLDSLDKNANYLIYCRTGHRSKETLTIMQQKGFTKVYDLAGGYNNWTADNLPIEK